MPKETKEQEQAETFVDVGTGLVMRRDPFGGDSPDVLGVFNPDEWEVLEEDFGPIIDWPTTPTVAGKLVAQKTVNINHDDERGEQPTNLYSLVDAVSNERRAFYGNYQLDQALGCDSRDGNKSPYMGRFILIRWEGKREQGKGGRTLNVYTVVAKREPVTVSDDGTGEDSA